MPDTGRLDAQLGRRMQGFWVVVQEAGIDEVDPTDRLTPPKGLEINGLKIPPAPFTPNLHLGRLNSHERTPFRSRLSQEV